MNADLILYNANVITLDPSCPRARAIVVKDGKILAVDRNDAWSQFRGPCTSIIDCHGETVLPAFSDAHCHLLALAKRFVALDISPERIRSISDMQEEIGRLAANLPPGKWIHAEGYDEFYLAEKRHPTRWDLDKASSTHPIKLTHRSGHAHVLNSTGLAVLGISKDTPDPPGGIIERDWETAEPTGVLYDMGDFLTQRIPPLGSAELERGISLANQQLLSWGIASIQDLSPENDLSRWQLLQQWKARGALKLRTSLFLGVQGFIQCEKERSLSCLSRSEVQVRGVKIVLQQTSGELNPTWEELGPVTRRIHHANLQIAFHAVEESTIDSACVLVEHLLREFPRSDHRHRVEHCSVCKPEAARRIASLGIVVVTQPAFVYCHGERYRRTVPEEQLKHLYAVATLISSGVKVAAGSDSPVAPSNPFIGIYAAVSRRTRTGEFIAMDERISTLDALKLYTLNAAHASFHEHLQGSISPGKLADLVILDVDPTHVPVEELKNLQVKMTIIGGEIAWARV
jgi:predicted amidohydrolase YtcJ